MPQDWKREINVHCFWPRANATAQRDLAATVRGTKTVSRYCKWVVWTDASTAQARRELGWSRAIVLEATKAAEAISAEAGAAESAEYKSGGGVCSDQRPAASNAGHSCHARIGWRREAENQNKAENEWWWEWGSWESTGVIKLGPLVTGRLYKEEERFLIPHLAQDSLDGISS